MAGSPLYWLNILTAGQWQSLFDSKQDALGYTPVNRAGDTMSGRLITASPGTNTSGFNLTPGGTPAAPADGDVWATTAGIFARIGGVTYQLSQVGGTFSISSLMVNFNSAGDNAIPLVLPAGFTRYLVSGCRISNATHSLVTATAGLFTAASGGGVPVVTAASAITVSSITDASANNAMAFTINSPDVRSYQLTGAPTLYFRVANPEGAAATATVTINLIPLP